MCRTILSVVTYRKCGHEFESWITKRCKEATENDENCPRPLVRITPVKTKKGGKCTKLCAKGERSLQLD